MGGASSKTKSSVTTKTVVDALMQSILRCSSQTTVTQSFIVEGNYNVLNNVRQGQYVKFSSTCAQDSKSMADIQQSVATAVKQAAESQSVSVLGVLGKSKAEAETNIDNEVRQVINQTSITEIINNTNLDQQLVIKGSNNIFTNVTQEQTMDILLNNTQKVVNELKSVQAIENEADQQSKATQTNFISDIITSIFDGFASLGWVWVIIIAVVVLGGGYVLMNGNPFANMFAGSDPMMMESGRQQSAQNYQGISAYYPRF